MYYSLEFIIFKTSGQNHLDLVPKCLPLSKGKLPHEAYAPCCPLSLIAVEYWFTFGLCTYKYFGYFILIESIKMPSFCPWLLSFSRMCLWFIHIHIAVFHIFIWMSTYIAFIYHHLLIHSLEDIWTVLSL